MRIAAGILWFLAVVIWVCVEKANWGAVVHYDSSDTIADLIQDAAWYNVGHMYAIAAALAGVILWVRPSR